MKKIFVICGHYGSGKTEFCVNLALKLRRETGVGVSIADFDVINPYFRSREKAAWLAARGIGTLGNVTGDIPGSDIPGLSANIYGALARGEFLIFDLAGSGNGLKPLALVREDIEKPGFEFLCVMNAFRPETASAALMLKAAGEMELFAGAKLSGIVHNSHLVRETTAETLLIGQEMVRAAAAGLNVPIMFTQARADLYAEIGGRLKGTPVVFEKLAMREDWQ